MQCSQLPLGNGQVANLVATIFTIFFMNSGISMFPTTNVCQLTSYQRQTARLIAFVQKMQKNIKMLSTSMSTSQLGNICQSIQFPQAL